MNRLSLGSLFSGYGGLDLAVEEVLGARTTWVSDIEPGPCKVLAHRFPHAPNLGDITKVDWTQVPPVDIISGGSPCQDISSAGRMAGMREGTRSNLWVEMRDAIRILRPRYVVWENVGAARSTAAASAMESDPGLLGDHPTGLPILRALGRVLGDLASLGYDAQWHSLRAADVGAPHGRLRFFVLATDANVAGLQERRHAGSVRASAPGASSAADGDSGLRPSLAVDFNADDIQGDRPTVSEDLLQACREGVLQVSGDVVGDGGRNGDGSHVIDRSDLANAVNLLPTPRATDGTKGGPNQRGSKGDLMLPSAVMQLLPTPAVQLLPTPGESVIGAKPGIKLRGRKPSDPQVGLADAVMSLLPTPAAGNFNAGEDPEQWLARRERVKVTANNGNGMGMPLGIAVQLLPTPMVGSSSPAAHGQISGQYRDAMATALGQWGRYAAAIARWESITRPAPSPTKAGRNGRPKLNPEFAAWMMGAPAGWITDVPGVTDNEALRMAGNGVVQQQASAALRLMLARMGRAAA